MAPVTNLVWLTSSSETFTDAAKAAMQRALEAQAAWVAAHVADAPAERGVALLQQVEDPRVVLETARWGSTEEHGAWLASDEYRASSAPLAAHFQLDQIEYFHLDAEVFGPARAEAGEEIPLLASPVVSVGRVGVAAADKEAFAKAWDGGKSVLVDFAKPHAVRSGFRKQKADPDVEECVFFVGWPAVERHAELAKTEDFAKYAGPLMSFAKTNEVKHYRRIL
ncbi:hypothetical protein F4775DRAFT_529115 [Biscogniauxia sp. FL1348]|nr:hypothetical protein F4775DRAFT_529115 [Biscogniauxia sp. FL1348]